MTPGAEVAAEAAVAVVAEAQNYLALAAAPLAIAGKRQRRRRAKTVMRRRTLCKTYPYQHLLRAAKCHAHHLIRLGLRRQEGQRPRDEVQPETTLDRAHQKHSGSRSVNAATPGAVVGPTSLADTQLLSSGLLDCRALRRGGCQQQQSERRSQAEQSKLAPAIAVLGSGLGVRRFSAFLNVPR